VLKDVRPRSRKLAGVVDPVAPVLLHQSRLWRGEFVVGSEMWKTPVVRETEQAPVESGDKCLWAMEV
jgi:hypothetical protein